VRTDSSWRYVKIGALGRVITGKTPPSARPELFGDAHPFITPSDIDGVSRTVVTGRFIADEGASVFKNQMIPAGAVCFVCIGATIGKMCIATRRSLTNQQVNSIVVDEVAHDPKYVFYALRQIAPNVIGLAGGAATPIISKSSFSHISIRVAPLEQQRRIGAILSAYDDLIENNTRRIAILEEVARRTSEEWFVQFRFPGHEGTRMIESEAGLTPEGWQFGTVADVAVVHRGRSYKGSELAHSGGRPFVNLKCMDRDGGFRSFGLKRYTGEFKESQTVRPGDLVMGITDMTQERRIVARVGRVSRLDAEFGVFSMDLVRIASRGVYPEPYLYAMFRWSGFADKVKQHANGANVLHLLPARIEEFRFARPPFGLAAQFAEQIAPMLTLCDALQQKNANLRGTRDLFLPKLITGNLDVSVGGEPEALVA
jgi:type I restriction enzyme S subunit